MSDDELPVFPSYPKPAMEVAPQVHKPLMKLMKNLAKPLKSRDPFHSRTRRARKMKKIRFY